MLKDMGNTCTLQNCLKKGTSDRCYISRRAASEMLFELLGYGALISGNGVGGGGNSVRREKTELLRHYACRKKFLQSIK